MSHADCVPWLCYPLVILSCASYSLRVFSLLRFNVFARTFQIAVVSCSIFQLARIRIDFYPIPLADHGACLCICECYMKTVIVFFYALIGIYGIDLTIHRKQSRFTTDIYRKPTTTDTIMANDSCHSREHKMAAIRYLHNRMITYEMSPENKQRERRTIQQILSNNKYDPSIIKEIKHKKKDQAQEEKNKWAKFTYIRRETRFIIKAFKNTKVKIAFTTDNTIKNLLTTRESQHKNKYDKSGVYQLECPSCNMKYIGQTGRSFKRRYQKHYRDYKHGSTKSKFAQHLLENKYSIDSIDKIMDIIHMTRKGKMMDTIEKFYIYQETKLNNQINDKLTVKPNLIFETLVRHDPHRGIPSTNCTMSSI